jgi:hypothetical protein
MKKILIFCIAAGFIATGCNLKNKPQDVATSAADSLQPREDSSVQQDNTLVQPES